MKLHLMSAFLSIGVFVYFVNNDLQASKIVIINYTNTPQTVSFQQYIPGKIKFDKAMATLRQGLISLSIGPFGDFKFSSQIPQTTSMQNGFNEITANMKLEIPVRQRQVYDNSHWYIIKITVNGKDYKAADFGWRAKAMETGTPSRGYRWIPNAALLSWEEDGWFKIVYDERGKATLRK